VRPATRPEQLPEPSSPALLPRLAALEEEVSAHERRRRALLEEQEATARFERLVVALAPFPRGLDPAVQPEIHGLVLRSDPEALALLEAEVRRITGGVCEVRARPVDAEHTGVLVTVPRARSREVTALLFDRGVDEIRLPAGYAGKDLVEVLLLLAARERELPGDVAAVDSALERIAAAFGPALDSAMQEAQAGLDRLRAARRCGETRFAFVISGWAPQERLERLRDHAEAALEGKVAVLAHRPAPPQWGEVPVILRNHRFVRPFEILLALVPLPRYGSTDPTPWMAIFFPLFFGLVLGDVVFGLAGATVSLVARLRGWGGTLGRDVAWVALCCSSAAAVFGVLFGEALGELGAHAGLHPILLHRREAVMDLFALAVAVGAAHVVLGMVLGVASALRADHRRHAAARAAKLGLLLSAGTAGAALLGTVPRHLAAPAALAAAAFLAVAVAAEGPLAALDLVLGLGNVLSYARLMALGLASVMLAEVANLVGGVLQPRAAGLAIAVLLHAVNFTLGLVSPTVAALRLHYVEFFEKFYDEGGAPFRPFALAA
jgi:V/A-type H+-transporting ATPase subunit I